MRTTADDAGESSDSGKDTSVFTDGTFTFVDLFCGIGGFHQALGGLGGTCVFASDIDADCRKTYAKNYGIEPRGDITKIGEDEIPPHNVLCAGFPCQSFSKAGKRLGFSDETKGTLFFDVIRVLRHRQPEYALLENVRNLASHDKGNTWRVIRGQLDSTGYDVLPEPIIFSPHYIGIPQHRERVFILCKRKDLGSVPPFAFDRKTIPVCRIDDVLQDDATISNIDDYRLSPDEIALIDLWNEFVRSIRCERLPGFPVWSDCLRAEDDIRKDVDVDSLPQWAQNFIRKNVTLWNANRMFIEDWLVRAKKARLFFGAKAKLEWQAGQTTSPDIWKNILQFRPSGIRVKPGTYFPALVAITQTSIVGRRRRYLTPRECARLQSFPDSFSYDEKESQAYKQFGNAVNVEVARLLARYLFGDREVLARYRATSHIGRFQGRNHAG